MIRGKNLNREMLLELLNSGFCKIQFRKSTNGRYRSLFCTLDKKKIPAKHYKSVDKTFGKVDDQNLMPVFDLTERDWKSFYISNVMYLHTEEELKGKKKSNNKNEKKK
jgi:hypothetical protein